MKDERGRTIRKDKKVYHGDGTYRWDHYKVWKRIVVNDPLGETARRALQEKDKDLEELTIDNIPIKSYEKVEQAKVNEQNFPKVSKDNTEELRIRQAKRRGFISTEESVE